MDVTPLIPAGRQLVNGYGDGGFRIAGRRWEGSVLVSPRATLAWAVSDLVTASLDEVLTALDACADPVSLLLLGCGRSIVAPPQGLRQALKARGVGLELMDTGAACRTFNVLLAEDRQAAAALIAV